MLHDHFGGFPIYEGVRLLGCVPIAYPPLLRDGVSDGVVEFRGRGVGEFGSARPELPLFPMDVVTGGGWG